MIILVFITFLTNLALIPEYGIVGASIATAISIVAYNIISFLFLKIKFNLQPFSKGTIIVILIALISYLAAKYVHISEFLIADSLIKSFILLLIFVPSIIAANVSEDINKMFRKLFSIINFNSRKQ
jgi:O-antigen/teichoic acid export membrane protein